jgi:uncharacterized protein (DUF2236 family)
MYDSARVLYELLVGALSPAERERLWDEYVRFGELFGMPRGYAPQTAAELDAWWQEQFASDRIFLTDYARAVGHSIATKLPLPLWARAPMRAGTHVLIGSLPAQTQQEYGFAWKRRDEIAFRALTAAHRSACPFVPKPIRSGSCLPFYATVARQERHNAQAGRAGFDLPDDLLARARSELSP